MMHTEYFSIYSSILMRNMEVKQYGHAGRPVLFIPCQNGRFFDFENFHMSDVWQPWIDSGRVMVFSIDTIDKETWSDTSKPANERAWLHEKWMMFIFDELVPFIRQKTNIANNWSGYPGIISFGCSLGATHAANLFFRRPDLFDGMLALSGIYTASYGFGGYMDKNVYSNSPVDYLASVPQNSPVIQHYNRNKGIMVVGQGDWEVPETTFRIKQICAEKGINVWVDIWGKDVKHDWVWWYKQVAYHIPHLLG